MQQKSRWPVIRRVFNNIHRWGGLTCGLVVIVVCFSGTMYVWNTEVTEAGARHLYTVTPPAGAMRLPVDSLLAVIRKTAAEPVVSTLVPYSPEDSYRFSTRSDQEGAKTITYFVNPYTGSVLGNSNDPNPGKEFMSTMFSLHRWLLLDRIKQPIIRGVPNKDFAGVITGTSAMLFTLGCITGLLIWFPQKLKSWRQGLKIRLNASWKRVNHDLHNSLGFYALIFLLMMGLTGPQFAFKWYRTGLQKVLGVYKDPAERSEKMAVAMDSLRKTGALRTNVAGQVSTIVAFLAAADSALPYPGDYQLNLPSKTNPSVTIAKYKTGFFAPAAPDRLTLDPSSARLQKKEIFSDKPFNERVGGSIKAIHTGEVYGTFTKVLWFLACLIGTTLPVTGTLIWWNKRKKKKKKPQPVLKLSSKAATTAAISPGSTEALRSASDEMAR